MDARPVRAAQLGRYAAMESVVQVALVLLVLLLGACRDAAPPPRAPVAPACYALTHGRWSVAPRAWSDATLERFLPPAAFALDTTERVGLGLPSARWRVARALDPTSRWTRDATRPSWRLLPDDTVHVVWSTGTEGVSLYLTAAGPDSLIGHAEATSDARLVGAATPRVPVHVVRTTCR